MVIFNVNVRGSVLYFESPYSLSLGRVESFLRPLIYVDGDRRLFLPFFFFKENIVQITMELVRM